MPENKYTNARILIVDDNETDNFMLASILKENGFSQIRGLIDPRRVLEQFNSFTPDLILLDLVMPFVDGFGVMEQLRPIIPVDQFLPILVLTADESPIVRKKALSSGAKDFLTKPIDTSDLLLRVNNLLETRYLYLRLQNQNQVLEEKVRERTTQLVESEKNYRSLFENVPVGIYRTTPDGSILNANPALVKMFGFPDVWSILAMKAKDLYAIQEDITRFNSAVEQNNLITSFDTEFRRFDGTTFWAEDNVHIIRNEQGQISFYEGSLTDITDRKRAEEALKKSEITLEEAQRLAHLGSWEWDPEADTTTWSKELYAIFEVDPTGPALSFTEQEKIYTPDSVKILRSGIEQAMTGVPYEIELEWEREDGSQKWLQARGEPRFDMNGRVSGLRGTALDITESKKAEHALRQKAHELQTLFETSLEINSQTSLDALLSSIVKRSCALLKASAGGLYLVEADGQMLKLVVGHNFPDQYIGVLLKQGEGLSGQVAQNGKPMIVDDYQTWQGRASIYEGTPFRQVLGVPLKIKDKVIGVINISHFTLAGSFSREDVQLASLFADQAALAIESARLYEDERARNRDLVMLYESALAISSDLTLDVLLKTIVEQATKVIVTDGCTLSSWDYEQDAVQTMLDYRRGSRSDVDKPGKKYFLKDYPATRHVLETRQTLLLSIHDHHIDAAELAWMDKQGISAALLLPMVARDQVIGLMEFFELQNKERHFTVNEMRIAQSLSIQAAICIENARLFEHADRNLRRTVALHKIDIAIASSVDIDLNFNVIIEQVIPQLGVDAADILLYDQKSQSLTYRAGQGFHTDALQHTKLRLGEENAGRAALSRRTILIPNLMEKKTGFLRSLTFSREGFVSYVGVPLIAKGEIKGVLEVFHRKSFVADIEWLDFLETLAGQTAIAIDNATMFNDLRLSNMELSLAYEATIEGWSRAMDLRDNETQNHTRRVTETTERLAQSFGIDNNDLVHIRRGALLHDIGKMGIPDNILLKPDTLNEDEWKLMKKHPQFAYDLLSPISYLHPAMDIPYCHHEKWDGTGYPRGLRGEQIPLAARIFAVVDVYDALTSDRPYRRAWSKESTLRYIRDLSGTHFDPGLIDGVLEIITSTKD